MVSFFFRLSLRFYSACYTPSAVKKLSGKKTQIMHNTIRLQKIYITLYWRGVKEGPEMEIPRHKYVSYTFYATRMKMSTSEGCRNGEQKYRNIMLAPGREKGKVNERRRTGMKFGKMRGKLSSSA